METSLKRTLPTFSTALKNGRDVCNDTKPNAYVATYNFSTKAAIFNK